MCARTSAFGNKTMKRILASRLPIRNETRFTLLDINGIAKAFRALVSLNVSLTRVEFSLA